MASVYSTRGGLTQARSTATGRSRRWRSGLVSIRPALSILRHATPRRNLASILGRGLLCSKSQGKLPVVWLHSPTATPWAALHVVKRHGGRVEGVVILEVEVPRS